MSHAQRVRRLEALEVEHRIYEQAQRMAEQFGGDVEEHALELRVIWERVTRFGMDAEIRLLAQELGKTEDEVRAEMEAETAEVERGE
jgi:hypothetical protein